MSVRDRGIVASRPAAPGTVCLAEGEGRVRKAVKTGDDVPDPPKPSRVIDASDATMAARAPIAACIAAASDSAGDDTFMIDASYVDE